MPLPADYISGTITLTNGSPDFTGTGTGWQAADFREGDILLGVEGHAGQVYVIAAITGNAAGTLTQEWAGTSGTYTYRMRYEWDSSRVSAQARAMVELLGNGNLESIAGLTGPGVVVLEGPHSAGIRPFSDFVNGVAYNVQVDTLPDRAAYDGQSAGFAVLVSDVGDGRSAVYSKASNTSGDWTDPAYITGPLGPLPDVEATVANSAPGTAPTVVETPIPGGVRLDFTLPEASGFYNAGVYDIGEAYTTDQVVRHNGSSFIALQAVPIGESPSSAMPPVDTAFWQVLAAKGADGDIDGVTSFWRNRILTDSDEQSARNGLGITGYGTAAWGGAEVIDANAIAAEGIRFVSSASTNLPEAANGFLWDSGPRNDAFVRQTFRPTFVSGGFAELRANPRVWERVLVDSVWGDWALQYSDKNLIAFGGDTGSGGSIGLVPAPSAGDAVSGKVLGASGSWVTAASVPRGHLYNLTLSNNTADATNDIDVASGECASDDTQPTLIRLASTLTKRLDASWASGNGNGGRDAGSIADGWWHVFAIRNPTSSAVDILFSVSAIAPTLPSGYTQKRRIGSFLRSSGAIVGFTQAGDNFTWKLPTNIYNVTDPGTSAILVTGRVPTDLIGIQAVLGVTIGNGTSDTARSLLITDPATTDATPTATLSTLRTPQITSATAAGQVTVGVSTAGQFRARVEVSGAGSFIRISAFGWIDLRGRCL